MSRASVETRIADTRLLYSSPRLSSFLLCSPRTTVLLCFYHRLTSVGFPRAPETGNPRFTLRVRFCMHVSRGRALAWPRRDGDALLASSHSSVNIVRVSIGERKNGDGSF